MSIVHLQRGRTRGSRLAPALGDGELGIWLLSAAMVLAALALLAFAGAGAERPATSSMHVPMWALVLGFVAAEQLVVHVHFRRSAHSMSLAEIPLVFALLFTGGWTVVAACTLGRVLALAFVRRLPPIRVAFNLGQFALGACVAVVVFHSLDGASPTIDPRVWLAIAAATLAASVFTVLMISAAVTLSEGTLSIRRISASLRTDVTVALANTSIGLCAARLVDNDWRTAILLTVPVFGMFATMRAYAAERERHSQLEFLYAATRALSSTMGTGDALASLLSRSLEAFRADAAEIVFFSPSGEEALRTTIHADGRRTLLQAVDADSTARLRQALVGQHGARLTDELDDGWLVEDLRSRDLGGGLFAVLSGESTLIGAVMIGHPSGVVDAFGPEDVKLFEALASNTSVALENDQLGHTVWEMKRLQGDLEHQASHDALTDLANRTLFAERLDSALARGRDEAAVIFIDVNDFKGVNDTLGHAAGDELLIAIAGRLADCVRPSDTLARLGGDEFAILLEDSPTQALAIEVAQRIDRRIDEPFSIAGRPLGASVSIGIALGDRDDITTEELIRNADLAMYRAKQAKSSRYELFQDGMEVPVLRHHGVRQRLREAAAQEAFAVHYQPIVDLDTGSIIAQEALVRWFDGSRGLVPPASFIPVAEEMGVIVTIGRQVLTRACMDAQTWPGDADHPAPSIHVNVSPVELRDEGFLAGVHAALTDSGLAPRRLVLEITESVVLSDPQRAIAILTQLRELGVQLALDDFGTGYSSLSHLRELPLDWLKIGQPFVDEIEPGQSNRPFMRMIVDLAASLHLRVVAEGIETESQMHALRSLGCGFGQGFHLGSPTASAGRGETAQLSIGR